MTVRGTVKYKILTFPFLVKRISADSRKLT